jgi:ketosteroid isomerase-like protein
LSEEERAAEVLEAEARWARAHLEGDAEALARLMHRDYAMISPDGRVVDRDEALSSYRSGDRRWDLAESDQHTVKLYGDTAVVIGRWRARGVNDRAPFDYSARYASVWVRESGAWRIVSDQSTEITG